MGAIGQGRKSDHQGSDIRPAGKTKKRIVGGPDPFEIIKIDLKAYEEERQRNEKYQAAIEEKYHSLGVDYNATVLGLDYYVKDYYTEQCPPDIKALVDDLITKRKLYQAEMEKLNNLVNGPLRDDIAPDEVVYWQNVKLGEEKAMIDARRQHNKAMLALRHEVENRARKEMGMKNIGEGWTNETLMFHLLKEMYPDEVVEHHAHPDWLEGLELDVYIPRLKLGFEYQGEQHFRPMEHWGGEDAYKRLVERDEKKAKLCKANGVRLLEIHYEQTVSKTLLQYLIEEGEFPNVNS